MKGALLFLLLVAAASAGTSTWSNMRVKYGATYLGTGFTHLWPVHNTLAEATASIWQAVTIESDLNVQFVAVREDDVGFTPFYDSYGHISGAQMCQPYATLLSTGPPTYFPTASGVNEQKSINGVEFICSRFLLVSPTVLRAGGRPEITTIGDSLWILDTTSTLGYKEIPVDLDVLVNETEFTWQNCFRSMGKHYFYNFTKEMECEQFASWFLLGQDNDVTGIGWQLVGQSTVYSYNWWDYLPRIAAEIIAPLAPECIYDWIETYGVISIHIYFENNPVSITCASGDSVETRAQTSERMAKFGYNSDQPLH